jgi:predicted amino acid racemase
MHADVFSLFGEIIELNEKPMVPMGKMGTNVEGENFEFNENDIGETSFRAIIDIGLLDVETDHIVLVDKTLEIAGASSDMIVIDLKENIKKYSVGDLIEFKLDYMGILRIINSKYIGKKISNNN